LADGAGADDEKGQLASGTGGVVRRREGDVVDKVVLMRKGELGGGGVLDLGKNDGGEGGCCGGAGGGGMFGEDGGAVSDTRVEERGCAVGRAGGRGWGGHGCGVACARFVLMVA